MYLMNLRRGPAALALAAALAAGLGATPAAAQSYAGRPAGIAELPAGVEKPTRDVRLSIGEGEIVNLPLAATHIWTSNPGAADVYVSNPRQIHLFGKDFGATTIFATAANGRVIWSASVFVSQNITSVDRMLKLAMPNADIKISMVGQLAVMTGTVASPEDSAQAAQLVASALNPGQKIDGTTALKVAVINRLRTAVPLQVNLQVRIAEVSRTYARQLNSNLSSTSSAGGNFQFGIGNGRSLGTLSGGGGTYYPSIGLGVGNTPYGYLPIPANATATNPTGLTLVPGSAVGTVSTLTSLAAQAKLGPFSILAALDAGENAGLVTTLANPNLTALSGETADFLAGGEFPIPISSGLGAVSIDYKRFGVSLSYTPTVLADGRISLRVRPEVSELSSQGSVTISGFQVPALTVRRAETTIELGSGQSFMIAGLLSNHANHTIQKLPGAGDVPVLGTLFRSTNFQRGETELVIVVTPYLVKPANDGDIKLPTDGLQNPEELNRVLGNNWTDGKSGAKRPGPTAGGGDAAKAAAPKISVDTLDGPRGAPPPAALTQAEPAPPPPAAKPKRTAQASSDAAPGFTLN